LRLDVIVADVIGGVLSQLIDANLVLLVGSSFDEAIAYGAADADD
jgi:hypothetical protein